MTTNGALELPEHRLKRVEAAALDYQSLMQERDDLDLRLHTAHKRIMELETQVDALQSMITMVESAAKSLEIQTQERIEKTFKMRDEFSERAVTAETHLANAYRILHDAVNGKVEEHDDNTTR